MAEIFRRRLPETSHAWTGERLVSSIEGQIETEHLHRYFLARELCRGKDVLDVASGEGYGAALLAQTAGSVVGVEIDPDSVAHATAAYAGPNLRYITGNATRLPLDDSSVDVVVSFETIEHIAGHEAFLTEIRRVLRPGGLLVISTPDAAVYSAAGSTPNSFHVRELECTEFIALLAAHFAEVRLLRQRVSAASALLPDEVATKSGFLIFERRDPLTFEVHRVLSRAPYLVALASDSALGEIAGSLLIVGPEAPGELAALRAEVERLTRVEEGARQGAAAHAALLAECEALQTALQETTALRAEVERLTLVEEAARHGAATDAALLGECVALRQASAGQESALEDARQRAEAQRRECEAAVATAQLHLAVSGRSQALLEQRDLMVRRLQLDMVQQGQALMAALADAQHWRAEAAQHAAATTRAEAERDAERVVALTYAQAYDRVSKLLIPVWLRRFAPPGLRHRAPSRR